MAQIKFYRLSSSEMTTKVNNKQIAEGSIWFDIDNKILKVYKDSAWESYNGDMSLSWTDASNLLNVKFGGVEKSITISGFADATAFSNLQTEVTNHKSAYSTKVAALEAADSALSTRIDGLVGEKNTDGTFKDAGKSIRTIANEELARQLLEGGEDGGKAQESFETLKELADWLEQHPDDVATMNSKISDLETWKSTHSSQYTELNNSVTAIKNSYVSSITDSATYIQLDKTKGGITLSDADLVSKINTMESAIASAASAGVTSFGGQAGAITLTTNSNTNGTINFGITNKVLSGTVVGLGSAAYTNANAYATSAQGTKADNALQSVSTGSADYLTVSSKDSNKNQVITPVIGVYGGKSGLATTSTTSAYIGEYVNTFVTSALAWAEF